MRAGTPIWPRGGGPTRSGKGYKIGLSCAILLLICVALAVAVAYLTDFQGGKTESTAPPAAWVNAPHEQSEVIRSPGGFSGGVLSVGESAGTRSFF